MSVGEKRIEWVSCARCNANTMHDIVCEHHENGGDEYHCDLEYAVVQCRGCGRCSFRYVFSDFEGAFPTGEDTWDIPKTIETYPKIIRNHKELDGLGHVPEIVSLIYSETLTAMKEGASVLAGLGLRGTIEAICNERKITGSNLEKRITKLAQSGLISAKDSQRLHAIRFLGNDAAHEIKKPTEEQLTTALKIVDHMLQTVYVLDKEARGSLDTIIESFEEFRELLERKLKKFSSGEEFPLAKFLGQDVRRIQAGLSSMESRLMTEVQAGNFSKLTVGKLDHFNNSQAPVQHFVVQ